MDRRLATAALPRISALSLAIRLGVAGLVMGLSMVFGLDENTISTVAGAVVSVASVITYIITEGKVDAAAVGDAVGKVQDAVGAVTKEEE